jgi:hypothetical protein
LLIDPPSQATRRFYAAVFAGATGQTPHGGGMMERMEPDAAFADPGETWAIIV